MLPRELPRPRVHPRVCDSADIRRTLCDQIWVPPIALSAPFGWWDGAPVYSLDQVGYVLILISVFYAVVSAIDYLWRFTVEAMKRDVQ